MKGGWIKANIGDICSLEYGKPLDSVDRVEDGLYPAYGANGIFARTNKYYYNKPSIIIGRKGTAGAITLTEEKFYPLDVTYYVVFDKNNYDLKFLYYLFLTKDIPSLAKGVKPGINRNDVYSLSINYPRTLSEQQRIVEILDTAFDKIDTVKQNAEINLKNIEGLFLKILSLNFIKKEGWISTELGNVCSLYQGLAINAKTKHLLVKNSNLPLLRIKDLKNGTEELYVSEQGYPKSSLVNEDEIIYTRTGSLGLVFTGRYGILHNNCFKIVPNIELGKNFLIWFLQEPKFRKTILSLAERAAQPDITHKLFKEQIISFPSLSEQQQIVSKLDALSAKCKELENNYLQTINDCDELKKAILAKAFNGEL